MAILIGSARHDENGKYSGGQKGDQLQKIGADGLDRVGEVSVQNFYNHKKGWVILRAKDVNLAKGIAFSMAIACGNANIGYDQSNRLGAYKYGVNTTTKTECDCSGLIRACIKQSGHEIPDFTTENEVSVLVNSGLFDKIAFNSASDLCNGDVLVTKSKGHTVAVISGAKNRNAKSSNPYSVPTINIKKGSRGDDVKWVQYELNEWGANLAVDGIAGNATDQAIRAYQRAYELTADGIVGTKTRNSLKEN